MHSSPFGNLPFNSGFGGLDPASRFASFGTPGSGELMMMMQMFMAITTQLLAMTVAQRSGAVASGMANFGTPRGLPENPGVGNFLGSSGGNGPTSPTPGPGRGNL